MSFYLTWSDSSKLPTSLGRVWHLLFSHYDISQSILGGGKLGSSACFYKVSEFINKRESFNGHIKDKESRRTNDGTRLRSDYIHLPVELC